MQRQFQLKKSIFLLLDLKLYDLDTWKSEL